MINLIQWNINSATKKKAPLIHTARTMKLDIIVLQETLLTNPEKYKLSGYNTFATPQNEENRGLAILIKSTIPAKMVINPIFCGDRVEVMAVEIILLDSTLTIYNIYRNRANNNFDLTQLFAFARNQPTLILGDFNAHHPILNSPGNTTEEGEHISFALHNFPEITLLNNGQATHIRGGRLDLAFLNTNLRQYATWQTDNSICQSDHFAINIELNLPQLPPIPPPPPRWNQDQADWSIFSNYIENWIENYQPPNDIDIFEQDIIKLFHEAADRAMPIKQPGRGNFKDSWYYCPEVRRLKTRLNRVRKIYRKRPTDINRTVLQEVAGDVTDRLTRIKQEAWFTWCSKLSGLTRIRDIWSWLKRVAGQNKRPKTATHPNPLQEAERIAESFSQRSSSNQLPPQTKLMQERLSNQRWEEINQACNQIDHTDVEYTLQELRSTYKISKDTAPGADRITYTMIRNIGLAGELLLLKLINKTHVERVRPTTWNQQDTQPIPKPNDPSCHRPISLLSCIEKTAEKMVLKRLIFKTGPLHPQLYAYREGVGTTECISDVLNCINNNKALIVFIDFEKAFELANPAAILHSLVTKGIKGHLLAWTKNYSTNRQARVKFQGHVSQYKNLENGTPQGGILSPFLFNILMENIAKLEFQRGVDIFIFADDVLIVSRGPNKCTKMQRSLELVQNKSMELGLKINTNKTKAMAIRSRNPQQPLFIAQQEIEWVNSYKYLGVYIDRQLKFDIQITHLRERAKARLAPMRYMTSLHEGAKFDIQKLYYMATTRSIIDYSAPALINLTDQQYARLEVLQNNALRLMLGAPMWTRLCNLQMEGNLPPLKTRIETRNIHIVAKTLLASKESIAKNKYKDDLNKHPLARRLNTYTANVGDIIRKHKLQNQFAKIKEDSIATGYTPTPWSDRSFTCNYTALPVRKELCNQETLLAAAIQAINKVENNNPYVVYTDGTVDPETQTAGAAVYSSNFSACWRTSNSASTMQTELIAISEALKYTVSNEIRPVVIHCDSKAAIQALQQSKIKENKNLITKIHVLLEQHKHQNRSVTLNWIPSHIGIPGNEKADDLAKQSKHIDQVQIAIQPSLQQIKNLTKNTGKQELINNVNLWVMHDSKSAKWYKKVTELIPPAIDKHTPRELAVIIHRLRLGYRATWEIVTHTNRPCNHCGQDTDAPLQHYLLQCPVTNAFRNNINIPQDMHSEQAVVIACDIAKNITENHHMFSNTLLAHFPPR